MSGQDIRSAGLLGPDDRVGRTLPETKTVSEALRRAGREPDLDPAAPPEVLQDPQEAYAGLSGYFDEVAARLAQVRSLIDQTAATHEVPHSALDAVAAPAFQSFLQDTLAEVSMRYVLMGHFTKPGSHPDERSLPGARSGAPEENVVIPAGLDPVLAESPAARLALAHGVDLVSGSDDGE